MRALSTIFVVCLTTTAWAKGLSTVMLYNEGPGVKVSDSLVLHPGVLLEGRYDSNPLATDENIVAAPYMRVIGHLDLATRPRQRLTRVDGELVPQEIEFRLKTGLAYREYFSDNRAVQNQQGLEVDAGLAFKWAPGRLLSFQLLDDYERSITPADYIDAPPQTAGGGIAQSITRDYNNAGVRANVVPGGGRLLFTVGYNFLFRIYENTGFENLNRLTHELLAEGKWRLFPKTAVNLQLRQGFVDYYESDATSPSQPFNVNSKPLRILAGLTGLFHPRLTTILQVGYGNGFYDDYTGIVAGNSNRVSYNGPLGRAEVAYRIGPVATLRVGFEHDFADSEYANYYIDEHPYVDYNQIAADRFVFRGTIDYRYRQYEGFDAVNDFNSQAGYASVSITDYDAHLVGMLFGVDYKIREWIYVGLAYDLSLRAVASGQDALNVVYTAGIRDFIRHQVIGRLGVSY